MPTVDQLMREMTLDEKLGQMFLLAFASHQLDEARILFGEYFVGASYIGNDNVPSPEAAIALTTELQRIAATTRLKIPLLLGADQEGAWSVMTPGSTTGPGNMGLGATGRPDDAYAMYEVIGRELRAVGLHAVFGPCADCNSNPYNSIIGMRAFGEKPGLVAAMTAAGVRGAHAGGAITSLKHFPGHGDTMTDTHRALPTVERDRSELDGIDLRPFIEGIQAGADMVMTSHIIFPAIDENNPATLSYKIMTDLLRGEMGFDGVVISDSMNMKAMLKNYAPADSAIQAFNAGVDLLMLAEEHYSHNAKAYIQQQTDLIGSVKQAVENGTLPMTRVDEAVRRVLTLKQKYGLWPDAPAPELSAAQVGTAESLATEAEVSRHAVAVLRDKRGLIPVHPSKQLTLVNTTSRSSYEILGNTRGIGPNQTTPAFDTFAEAMRAIYPDITTVSAEEFELGALPNDGLIVAVTENYALPGVDFDTRSQSGLISALHQRAGDRLIVVALRDPYELTTLPPVETYLCVFSFRPASARAAAEVLSGAMPSAGSTPVGVPGTEFKANDLL